MIKSVYEDGYWWVEVPDDEWRKAEFSLFVEGRGMDFGSNDNYELSRITG